MIITVSLQIRFRVIPSSSNDSNQKCRNLVFQILGSQQVSRSDETIDHNYMYVQVAQCKKLYIGLLVCGILNIAVSIQLGHRGRTGCNTKKYTCSICRLHLFWPWPSTSLAGIYFTREVGRRLAAISGESREVNFICQRISICILRQNVITFRSTFTDIAQDEA